MKLEEGKRYITRGGLLTSTLKFEFKASGYDYIGVIDGYRFSWLNDGTFKKGDTSTHDLVEELEVDAEPVSGASKESVRVFETGSKRDSDHNKPLVNHMDAYVRLRFGYRLRDGATKYDKGNWRKLQPDEAALEALNRHLAYYEFNKQNGTEQDEDHLSGIIFNVMLLMKNEEKNGIRPDHYFGTTK